MQRNYQKSILENDKIRLELNCDDKLIRDEVNALNKKSNKLPSYCFTEKQAKEIAKRCIFKCKIETDGQIYIITKIGRK